MNNANHTIRKTLLIGLSVFLIAFVVNTTKDDETLALYPVNQVANVSTGIESESQVTEKENQEIDIMARDFRKGTDHPLVKELEQELKNREYFKGNPDTTFGADTEISLKQFQSDNGLPATGALTQETFLAIFQ